jgi:hypothetical protein
VAAKDTNAIFANGIDLQIHRCHWLQTGSPGSSCSSKSDAVLRDPFQGFSGNTSAIQAGRRHADERQGQNQSLVLDVSFQTFSLDVRFCQVLGNAVVIGSIKQNQPTNDKRMLI